jgi:hypothetical protein
VTLLERGLRRLTLGVGGEIDGGVWIERLVLPCLFVEDVLMFFDVKGDVRL